MRFNVNEKIAKNTALIDIHLLFFFYLGGLTSYIVQMIVQKETFTLLNTEKTLVYILSFSSFILLDFFLLSKHYNFQIALNKKWANHRY